MFRKWSLFMFTALTLVAAGCGTDDANQADTGSLGDVSTGTGVGQLAPDFTLSALDGESLTLSGLRGKTVLLDFWDTWCPPCREAMPHLQDISHEFSEDVVVVGIAAGQEGEAKVRSFVGTRGLTFPMAIGSPQVFQDYRVSSLPTTYLVDGRGIVRKMWIGGQPKAEYEGMIRQIAGG
ncbi:MAG: TlpA disulfide reductase family protein [bacterium]